MRTNIRNHVSIFGKKEIIIFFIVIPLLLTSFYLLPSNIKSYLILKAEDPTLLSVFLSSYVHESFDHFIGNIFSYFVLMFIIYIIETDKKRFYRVSAIAFLFLPVITSFVNIYQLNNIKTFLGFSDIVAFYIGYLIYALYRYLKVNYIEDLNTDFVWLIVGINFILASITWKSTVFFILSMLFVIYMLFSIGKKRIFKIINGVWKIIINESFNNTLKTYLIIWYKITVIIITVFYSFSLPILVKFQIINNSSVSNIISHYIGWLLGVMLPTLIEMFFTSRKRKVERSR